jgi:hypothetical protein
MHHAIQKHGFDNFEATVLIKVDSLDELNYYEKELIAQFNCMSPNGYNLTAGGDTHECSEETRQKLRQAAYNWTTHPTKGWVPSEETKKRMSVSASRPRKPLSESHKKAVSVAVKKALAKKKLEAYTT